MITKRRLALLSSLTAAPVFAAPFLAIGDNAELFLTARTELRYEDNVTYSSDDEIEAGVFEFTPGAEVTFGKNSLTKGSLAYFERTTSYFDGYNDLNSNLSNLLFTSTYEGAKLQLGVDASFRELNQNSRDARNAATLVRRDVYAAGADAEYSVTEKSKVGLGGKYDRIQYKVGGFNDQKNYTVPVNYYFAITPKVDLSAGVEYRKTDVTDVGTANSDSDNYYFNVGARGEFTAKLSGKFSVGYLFRDPDAAGADNESSVGIKTGLAYAYSPKTTFTLDLSNDFETGSDASGIEVSTVSFGVTTSLTAELSFTATVGYSRYDYLDEAPSSNAGRQDDYIVGGFGFTYTLNEHVNFEAGYSFNDNDSDIAGASFTANVVRLAANFRY